MKSILGIGNARPHRHPGRPFGRHAPPEVPPPAREHAARGHGDGRPDLGRAQGIRCKVRARRLGCEHGHLHVHFRDAVGLHRQDRQRRPGQPVQEHDGAVRRPRADALWYQVQRPLHGFHHRGQCRTHLRRLYGRHPGDGPGGPRPRNVRGLRLLPHRRLPRPEPGAHRQGCPARQGSRQHHLH